MNLIKKMILSIINTFGFKIEKIKQKNLNNNAIEGARIIGHRDNITLGKSVTFGSGVILHSSAKIEIGDYTMIAVNVIIHTSTHNYYLHPMWAERIDKPVKIGKHVWIGAGAIILPGVIVEDFSVIGAGAVVTANVPKGAIVVGNPAKLLKYRDSNVYNSEMQLFNSDNAVIISEKYNSNYIKNP